jgi:hypothetical protein
MALTPRAIRAPLGLRRAVGRPQLSDGILARSGRRLTLHQLEVLNELVVLVVLVRGPPPKGPPKRRRRVESLELTAPQGLAIGRRVIKCRFQYKCAQKQLYSYVPLSTLRLRSALNDFTADG